MLNLHALKARWKSQCTRAIDAKIQRLMNAHSVEWQLDMVDFNDVSMRPIEARTIWLTDPQTVLQKPTKGAT